MTLKDAGRMLHQGGRRTDATAVEYVPMPLLVRSAWLPEQRLILIDEALDEAGRAAAYAELVWATRSARNASPRRDLSGAEARRRRREAS